MDCLYKSDLPYTEVEKSVKSPFEVKRERDNGNNGIHISKLRAGR